MLCHDLFKKAKYLLSIDYSTASNVLESLHHIEDLGVTFDLKLNFMQHVECIVAAAYKSFGFIIRNSKGIEDRFVEDVIFQFCSV